MFIELNKIMQDKIIVKVDEISTLEPYDETVNGRRFIGSRVGITNGDDFLVEESYDEIKSKLGVE